MHSMITKKDNIKTVKLSVENGLRQSNKWHNEGKKHK